MSTDTAHDALLTGGPRDGEHFTADGAAVVELQIDGFIHRYVITTKRQQRDGREYTVYNYDGQIDPTGAQSGVETTEGSPRR